MKDPRLHRLAEILIDHSCQLSKGEKVLIEAFDLPDPALVCRLIELAAERGAEPYVSWKNNAVLRTLYTTGTENNIAQAGAFETAVMERMDAYIGIRGAANSSQFSDVPRDKMELYEKLWWHPVHIRIRVPETHWVVLRYPTDSFAQSAHMSSEAFEDFYFDVCTADYAQMARDLEPLEARMRAADKVRITAPGTELEFSIKGMNVRPCAGQRNIPDGEVLHRPAPRERKGPHPLQRPLALSGHGLRGGGVRPSNAARSSRPPARTSPRSSTRSSTRTRAPATSANGRWAATTSSSVRCSTSSSTRRSAAQCTSPPARPTKNATTATAAWSTGTWC